MVDLQTNRTYQSHDSQEGMSDSRAKLKRLSLPIDMSGKSFLDLGCNEGFFCNVAVERGATRVVGIDYVAENITSAKQRYGDRGIEFQRGSWHNLPVGVFDIVLWSSAMHYDLHYSAMFPKIISQLAPGGTFILECGAVDSSVSELVPIKRHSDTLFYPSQKLLLSELGGYFDFRVIDSGTIAEGDPVPRLIFHCTKPFTNVYLLSDRGSARGSQFRLHIASSGVKFLSLDRFCSRLRESPYIHGSLQRHILDNWASGSLDKLSSSLQKEGLLDEFITMFLSTINSTDRIVWIDLCIGSEFTDRIIEALRGRAVVWKLSPHDMK